jgi:hypothetical protein
MQGPSVPSAHVNALVALAILAVLIAVVLLVSAPLRRVRRSEQPFAWARGDLDVARDAKYREIRDAELDYRTGKLSREDYEAVDAQLRREALAILDLIEPSPRMLEEHDRVHEEQDREEDGPAVEVPLDHRAPAQWPGAAADAEGAGEPGILPGVHQHEEDQHDGDDDLQDREDRFHPRNAR